MIQLFKSYLETKVSYLDDLIAALVIVQRKRKRKRKVLQRKNERPVEPIITSKVNIIGISKTSFNKQYHLVGESKTLIPDLSPYIPTTKAEATNEVTHSICVSLTNEDTDEVDLSEEEIKLETIQNTATGVSIEDIEAMNKAETKSNALSFAQRQRVRNTAEILSGTELVLKSDPKFSEKLHSLLEHCEQTVNVTDKLNAKSTEIDDLF